MSGAERGPVPAGCDIPAGSTHSQQHVRLSGVCRAEETDLMHKDPQMRSNFSSLPTHVRIRFHSMAVLLTDRKRVVVKDQPD